ncbi:MAG: hypothetical protein ACK41D_06180 [Rubricoccaceae bacterium]
MSPEEFERLKEQEKAHLRQLRALKARHREAERTASTLGALRALADTSAAEALDAAAERLSRDAARQEARLDLALEGRAETAASDADREALRRAEAEALVARLRAGLGDAPSADAVHPDAGRSEEPPPAGKTIGRPRAAAPPEPPAPDDKTIGRRPR